MSEKGYSWPVPKNPKEAVKRWGKSGTVSVDIRKLKTEMKVLVTLDEEVEQELPRRRYGSWADPPETFDPWENARVLPSRKPKVTVRFSGHPEALLAMFRALHIEYAKKVQARAGKKPRRSIILGLEGEEEDLHE